MCTQIREQEFRLKACAHVQMCNTTCRCENGAECGDKCGHSHRYRWLRTWSISAADAKLHRQILSDRSEAHGHMTAWPAAGDFSVILSIYSETLWPFSHWYMCKCTNRPTHRASSLHLWICFKHLQVGVHFTLECDYEIVHTFTKSQHIYRCCHTFPHSLAAIKIPQPRLCHFMQVKRKGRKCSSLAERVCVVEGNMERMAAIKKSSHEAAFVMRCLLWCMSPLEHAVFSHVAILKLNCLFTDSLFLNYFHFGFLLIVSVPFKSNSCKHVRQYF